MKMLIITGILSAGLVVALAGTASAETNRQKYRRDYDSYAYKYPNATPRQLRNARAYDRGEYYEQDSNAHPVGSRAWWELKEREGGSRRF
jgi:hypothetical protein